MLRRAIIASIVSFCVLGLLPFNFASAAVSTGASGLKISPVRTDLEIDPGQTSSVPVLVTNVSNQTMLLQAVVDDFTSSGASGYPVLLFGNNTGSHGLKQFISPVANISLAPQQQSKVNVEIKIPKGTSGGGYYAAVRFSPVTSGNTNSVTLSASVATLILVTVPGPGLNEQLSLAGFGISRVDSDCTNNQSTPNPTCGQNQTPSGSVFFGSKNLEAFVNFHNGGNVQTAPFGSISVTNVTGKTVVTRKINQLTPPGSVLPGSNRTFSVPLSGIGLIGKYTLNGFFGYGSKGTLLDTKKTFYVISPWIIVIVVVVLLLIIGICYLLLRRMRRHHRQAVTAANRSK